MRPCPCLLADLVPFVPPAKARSGQRPRGGPSGARRLLHPPEEAQDRRGRATITYHANVEVLITFLTAYGVYGAHAMNLNWPADLVVGAGDLTALLTGFNFYPPFEETLCSWEVVNVASHGWILEEIGADAFTEAYVHESTYDEFDLGDETYGQCLLNSFDLEMVYLPDSVVRLTFARKFLGNPTVD